MTLDDNLVTIPNNKFLAEVTASANAGALDKLVQMDFFIGIDQDLALALAKRLVTFRSAHAFVPHKVRAQRFAVRENVRHSAIRSPARRLRT